MKEKTKIISILTQAGVRNTTDSLGNVWTYYGPQIWVSTVSQANKIVADGLYN